MKKVVAFLLSVMMVADACYMPGVFDAGITAYAAQEENGIEGVEVTEGTSAKVAGGEDGVDGLLADDGDSADVSTGEEVTAYGEDNVAVAAGEADSDGGDDSGDEEIVDFSAESADDVTESTVVDGDAGKKENGEGSGSEDEIDVKGADDAEAYTPSENELHRAGDINDNGTEDDPCLISSAEDMEELAQLSKTRNLTGYYKLTQNITLTSDNWAGIGNGSSYSFKGTFDGNNYTISGLKINSSDTNTGLFEYLNGGTIKNLNVSGTISSTGSSVGGLVGASHYGSITGCSSSVEVKGSANNAGGLVGSSTYGIIENCYTTGNVTGTKYCGGLVGYNYSKIISCHSSSIISGDERNGGLVGKNGSDGSVMYSYATGTVKGTGSYNGGLVGENDGGTISYCYATGKVTGVGSLDGGLVGSNGTVESSGYKGGKIIYCYAVGSVDGGAGGGLAGTRGYYKSASEVYSYYNQSNTGTRYGYGVSLADMRKQSTYYGWDFDHVWEMGTSGYPEINLRGETGTTEIEGSGDDEDPYLIKTEQQLFGLVNGNLNKSGNVYYKLANDIELTVPSWKSIDGFGAIFDGAGHTISGLRAADGTYSYAGLFGTNSGTIKNLNVEGEITRYADYAGILCAYNTGTIENCSVSGSTSLNLDYQGGLAGYNSGIIRNCTSNAKVSGSGKYNGGLAGENRNGTIESCVFSGSVDVTGDYAGGIAGYNNKYSGTVPVIKDCKSTGAVTGASYSGGISGYSSGTVENCISESTISGSGFCGGLVGENYGGTVIYSHATGAVKGTGSYNGGLVGYNHYGGMISYSYATGKVNGSGSTDGGLVGKNGHYTGSSYSENSTGLIEYCYATGVVDGGAGGGLLAERAEQYNGKASSELYSYYNQASTGTRYGYGVSLADMKKQSTYYGWDFDHVWEMGTSGYPEINLRGETGVTEIEGSGDDEDPYLIKTELQLFGLVNGNLNKSGNIYYKLANDIELTVPSWKSIEGFGAIFDGAGHTISGLKVADGTYEYAGLFGTNSGTIKNLKVEGEITRYANYAGILCAYNTGTIENCSVSGSTRLNLDYQGGLVGYNGGTIKNCKSETEVSGSGTCNGGLVGKQNGGTIISCEFSGSVNATGNYAGGIVGWNYNTVRDSKSTGTVTGASYSGGISGYSSGTVENCISESTISGSGYCGGLVGENYGGTVIYSHATGAVKGTGSYNGGLVGYNHIGGMISYSYATGKVNGSGSTDGGLVGKNGHYTGSSYSENSTGLIEYCYATGVVDGGAGGGLLAERAEQYNGKASSELYCYYNQANSGTTYGYGVSLADMRKQSTYYGWDFDHVWEMGTSGYPEINLRGEAGTIDIEGTGDDEDPYLIKSEYQLFGLVSGQLPKGGKIFYRLENDLKLSSVAWKSIDDFAGVFDGNGHKISGMKIDDGANTYSGFFGNNSGTIRNLTVEGSITRSADCVGLLCANNTGTIENCVTIGTVDVAKDYRGGLAGVNSGTIKDCVSKTVVKGDANYGGGLVGKNTGTITGCSATEIVEGKDSNGGLVGYNEAGTIRECYTTGAVTGIGYNGGLVGDNKGGNISYSYATGAIKGTGDYNGGLVGYNYESGKISCCYATGKVTGKGNTDGGLVGLEGRYTTYSNEYTYYPGYIEYSFATGVVDGGTGGGLVGKRTNNQWGCSIERFSYYNQTNTGGYYGFPVKLSDMAKQDTFYGWDFEHVWEMGPDGYPVVNLRGNASEDVEIRGLGEDDNPYIIETEEQLFALAQGKLPLAGKVYYELGNDIALTNDNWSPIIGFGVTLDGKGHTISGLKCHDNYIETALFADNSGTIKNLTVNGEIINCSMYSSLICAENTGVIENCRATGTINAANCTGGLVAYNKGTITKCTADTSITSNSNVVGGLSGVNTGTISESCSQGKVYIKGVDYGYAGGLVGNNYGSINNSYSSVNVTATDEKYGYVGGLVGCNNDGNVDGYRKQGSITGSYAMGRIRYTGTGDKTPGGLVGFKNSNTTITSSYYASERTGCEDTGKGEPLTNAQMKQENSFEDWDFTEVWGLYDSINSGFPFLQALSGDLAAENLNFWYQVKESKRGFAKQDQTLAIYYKADAEAVVTIDTDYTDASGSKKSTTLSTVYDSQTKAFKAELDLSSIRQVDSLKANIKLSGKSSTEDFAATYWYQLPLRVEGIVNVKLNDDIRESADMTVKLYRGTAYLGKKNVTSESDISFGALTTADNYKVVIYGGNIEYASLKNINVTQGRTALADFSSIPAMASLRAEFYLDGERLNDNNIKLKFIDKTNGKNRLFDQGIYLEYLSEGDEIGYTIVLPAGYRRDYRQDTSEKSVKLTAGDNVVKVELEKFKDVTFTGKVTESDGVTPVSGVTVTAVQSLNGTYSQNYQARTDEAGEFSLNVKNDALSVTLSKTGYKVLTDKLGGNEIKATDYILKQAQGRTQFNVSYVAKTLAGSTDTAVKYNLKPDEIRIINESTMKKIEGFQDNWPYIYLDTDEMEKDDWIRYTIRKKGYADADISVQVPEGGDIKASGTVYELGGMLVSLSREDGQIRSQSQVVLFDSTGQRVDFRSGTLSSVEFTNLEAGKYTVIAADAQVPVSAYSTLSVFRATNYYDKCAAAQVDVEDGIVALPSEMVIPVAEGVTSFVDRSKTSTTLNKSNAMIGDVVTVRSQAVIIAGTTYSDGVMELTIPEGMRYVEDSLTIDGAADDAIPSDNVFTIPMKKRDQTIRYRAKVLSTVDSSKLDFTGKISYTVEGEEYINTIENAVLTINDITLSMPDKVYSDNVVARGIAPAGSDVLIYDGNVMVGRTTAGKYGVFRTEITLAENDGNNIHYLKAEDEKTGSQSPAVRVAVGGNTPYVTSFSLTHNGKTWTTPDPNLEIGNISMTMVPSKPYDFNVYFSDNDGVADVRCVIDLTNGQKMDVELDYNSGLKCYSGSVTLNSSKVPNGFGVSFIPVKYSYTGDERGMELDVLSQSVTEKEATAGEAYYVESMKLDDVKGSKLYSYNRVVKKADFSPGESHVKISYGSKTVYVNPMPLFVKHDGVLYSVAEAYIKNGSVYSLWQRGIGIQSTVSADEAPATVSAGEVPADGGWELQEASVHSAGGDDDFTVIYDVLAKNGHETDECKELTEILKSIKNQTYLVNTDSSPADISRSAKALEEYLENLAAKTKDRNAKITAEEYVEQLQAYTNLDSIEALYDMIRSEMNFSKAAEGFTDAELALFTEIFESPDREALAASQADLMQRMMEAALTSRAAKYGDTIKNILKESWSKGSAYVGPGSGLSSTQKVSTVKTSVDPSGFVYETFEDNRLEGVKVTLYFENDAGAMEMWDAEEYEQENPLYTDMNGYYSWDVPEGNWQVKYEKDGYDVAYSDVLPVPPPQLDVNIGLVSNSSARISKVETVGDGLKITFDKYVQADSILRDVIKLYQGNEEADTKIVVDDAKTREFEGEKVTNFVLVQLTDGIFETGDAYKVSVSDGLRTYTGADVEAENFDYVVSEVKSRITFGDNIKVMLEDEELESGAFVHQNDRIRVTATAPEGERLTLLSVNGKQIENDSYVTVADEDVVITATFRSGEPILATAIELDKNSVTLEVGESVSLNAVITPRDADDKRVKWESSKESVAVVSGNGVVTAISAGEARISVSPVKGEGEDYCNVLVKEKKGSSSSSPQKEDSSSSTEKGSSSSTEKESSSSSSEKETSSSSTEKESSSSSTEKESSSSSMEKETSSSSSEKETSSSSSEAKTVSADTLYVRTMRAVSENRGSAEDEAVLLPAGKSAVIVPDKDNALVTVAKGNKLILPGDDKSFISTDKSLVAVSSSGTIKAKKFTASPVTINYTMNGEARSIRLMVMEPGLGQVTPVTIKKLNAAVSSPGDIEMIVSMPLNMKPQEPKIKGGAGRPEIKIDPVDCKWHLKCNASSKGNVSLPVMVNGKKFTIKIKVS